jgi:phage-related baseplate assembly protein
MADFDLASYPKPEAIEEVSAEVIIAGHKARFLEEWEALRAERPDLNLPAFNTAGLESEETSALFGATSYRELLLRIRVNEAVRANLLAFATGADLDHLAAFYGVVRMVGEADARLRVRTILEIRGRSTGGTAPRYEAVAMASSIRVRSARAYRAGRDPTVHVAIYAEDNAGLADEPLLATVRQALSAPDVRMVNDIILVASAVFQVVNVAAEVWLLPTASDAVLPVIAAAVKTKWSATSSLGFDLTSSWLIAALMQSGIQRVRLVTPESDVAADPFRAVSIGTVTLTNMGRDF